LTLEQLEVARAERMRQNGHGVLTLEEARTWIEETGLCLFLPKRQFSSSLAPSFVEAVAGLRNVTPESRQIAAAEELLVRLELDGVVVRLNLLGQPGEQPDYVVAAWVLPYVYALRGDRDWRRSPQLTGSRQVSPLAIQAYKQLETGDMTIAELKQNLGHGVSEAAVLRAITELWQQLRIIPVVAAPGKAAKWQLLRHRFQKAIAEGASTSQVTAISVLASIFLQAVIAAGMEEVEIFLSPLTARSKIREVIRGLVATRQVHTLSLGHAPHFYVAGTLPEFAPVVTRTPVPSAPRTCPTFAKRRACRNQPRWSMQRSRKAFRPSPRFTPTRTGRGDRPRMGSRRLPVLTSAVPRRATASLRHPGPAAGQTGELPNPAVALLATPQAGPQGHGGHPTGLRARIPTARRAHILTAHRETETAMETTPPPRLAPTGTLVPQTRPGQRTEHGRAQQGLPRHGRESQRAAMAA